MSAQDEIRRLQQRLDELHRQKAADDEARLAAGVNRAKAAARGLLERLGAARVSGAVAVLAEEGRLGVDAEGNPVFIDTRFGIRDELPLEEGLRAWVRGEGRELAGVGQAGRAPSPPRAPSSSPRRAAPPADVPATVLDRASVYLARFGIGGRRLEDAVAAFVEDHGRRLGVSFGEPVLKFTSGDPMPLDEAIGRWMKTNRARSFLPGAEARANRAEADERELAEAMHEVCGGPAPASADDIEIAAAFRDVFGG